MTFSLTAGDVRDIVEIATIVGSIVAFLVSALVIYFVVRPSRRQRRAQPETDALDREEMLALMDRMERRLATLERLVTQDAEPARIAPRGGHEISKAVEDRELGRTK